jgi:flagellar biosynthesis GTPase FlhF
MSTTSRVAGAVAAGYALGRFKKLRLAVLVGTAMASPKFRAAAAGMLQDRLPGGAITGTLTKEVGGKLVNVGKTAATTIVASRIDSLSQSLADRSENLRKAAPGGQADKSQAEEPADEYEEQEDEEAEEPTDEYEEQEDEEAEEPTDEYEEQEDEEAEEPTEKSEEQEASQDEQPDEPVARSPRRRRSASPAGRRRG